MKIKATVVWPVTVTVDVPDDATTEQKRRAILATAELGRCTNDPVITDSTDEDCID